ncbi:hypothetical protein [Streptomyces diastatochromogenes]|uniref:DUF485 domain-containing protein n=1 Tax=Streptomyces diastatochromogenes TaxID=42236 RepID=A0A233S9A4_STRDA|nr:hypothetical protein [Streptomyces diastatochromogenes]MCZ0991082.1 hypothetical protein [Streptomyces diastatochromogenes]OXY92265.1 hypothetical protein BEK98_26075 [Streptomyces diastatochromogenes]
MRSYSAPKPPDEAATDIHLQRGEILSQAVHRAQRVFLAVNAVPLAVGVVLSCVAAVAAVPVYGRLTLGVVWGVLQLGVFVATAWRYEKQATLLCDPIEQSLTSGMPQAGTSGASPVDELWR